MAKKNECRNACYMQTHMFQFGMHREIYRQPMEIKHIHITCIYICSLLRYKTPTKMTPKLHWKMHIAFSKRISHIKTKWEICVRQTYGACFVKYRITLIKLIMWRTPFAFMFNKKKQAKQKINAVTKAQNAFKSKLPSNTHTNDNKSSRK